MIIYSYLIDDFFVKKLQNVNHNFETHCVSIFEPRVEWLRSQSCWFQRIFFFSVSNNSRGWRRRLRRQRGGGAGAGGPGHPRPRTAALRPQRMRPPTTTLQ